MEAVSQMKEYLSSLYSLDVEHAWLGAGATIYSARPYLEELQPHFVIIKLDFQNTFHNVRRDKVQDITWDYTLSYSPTCSASTPNVFTCSMKIP